MNSDTANWFKLSLYCLKDHAYTEFIKQMSFSVISNDSFFNMNNERVYTFRDIANFIADERNSD